MSNKDAAPQPEARHDQPAILQKRWESAGRLKCTLSVEIEAPGITVGDLLDLTVGSVINTHNSPSKPVPVRANGVTVARGDFEVIGKRVGIRISEISEDNL